ncbi:hypothetical protein [Anaerobium acetethylicum]|uniref:Resolvase, N terminal domain n=1 Tax=Anaerobium acetethylicum TaxID=1619234 RepID=A0A1D3TWH8_9FIRM|nr:hypothetical protein [Anaerobium acetethylicum]SCP98601.1 hypothetical protein SAMN05421730_102318 [Anaerobium acetethylicum]
MSKKKKLIKEKITCVAYLSTDGDLYSASNREAKQLRYIKEYANAHNIEIVKIMHRDILGQADVNRHFEVMVEMVRRGKVQGIILSNMLAVSTGVPDAYYKVGKVRAASGYMVTVDEGILGMVIKEN